METEEVDTSMQTNGTQDTSMQDEGAQDEFIPGTTFKSHDELIKGYQNLKSKFDSQGNELGSIRKEHEGLKSQAETLALALKENLGKGQRPVDQQPSVKPIDYASQITEVEQQIQNLDPMDSNYQRTLAALVTKSNKITAQMVKDQTLSAAHEVMKKELSDRDSRSAKESFLSSNPEFNTPEMQARIKSYIAKDKTGMSDALSAFREIQRDDVAIEAKRLMDENAEYKRLLNLSRGKEEAGKVVVTGQTTVTPQIKPTKATGKDLDAGMMAALQAQRSS